VKDFIFDIKIAVLFRHNCDPMKGPWRHGHDPHSNSLYQALGTVKKAFKSGRQAL
jgi:hypothetical protein